MKRHMKKTVHRGFTLLELLIVVAILGILTAIALPRFVNATNRARSSAERANIRNIDTQLELYQVTTGLYPDAPNMPELLTSSSYFPDEKNGNNTLLSDPFTGDVGLGVYTLDISGAPKIMRVEKFKHFYVCRDPANCPGANCPGGHDAFVCD